MRLTRLETFPGVRAIAHEIRPSAAVAEKIDAIWKDETEKRGRSVFNGRIFSVLSHDEKNVDGFFTEYKFWQAQRREPSLYEELKIVRLAVSGIVRCADGLLLGQRGGGVQQMPGEWELIPAGGIDQQALMEDGTINLERQMTLELAEEAGIPDRAVNDIIPFGMIEDEKEYVIDMLAWMDINDDAAQLKKYFTARKNREYSDIKIVARDEIKKFTSENNIIASALRTLEEIGQ